MLACCNNDFLSINSSEHVIWGDPSLKDLHRNRLHREVGIIKNNGFAVPRCWHCKRSWLCYMIMFALQKKWLCRCHPKRSWFYYITTLASQKIISSFHYDVGIKEIYLPQVPVKSSHKVARKVITNELPHIFIIPLPYFKTCIYTPFHTGLRASFPKGVRNRWGGSAQVLSPPSNHLKLST